MKMKMKMRRGKGIERMWCIQRLKRKLNVRSSDECSLLAGKLPTSYVITMLSQGGQVGRYVLHRGALEALRRNKPHYS
jgi:hypothetical protein